MRSNWPRSLAHEVGHIANRDGINSISQARWTEVATTAAPKPPNSTAASLGQLVSQFEGSIDDVLQNRHRQRLQPNRGKRTPTGPGWKCSKRAGYNPAAMTAILTAMSSKGGSGGILGTHPAVADRLDNIKVIAQEANTRWSRSHQTVSGAKDLGQDKKSYCRGGFETRPFWFPSLNLETNLKHFLQLYGGTGFQPVPQKTLVYSIESCKITKVGWALPTNTSVP